MLGRAFRRKAQHGDARLEAGDRPRRAAGHHGDLGQLLGRRVGVHRTVGEHHHALFAEHRVGDQHDERTGNHADAGQRLDILESGTQHVAGRIVGPGHLAVGVAGLHHERTQIERVDDQFLGLFLREPLGRTQLEHQIDVLLLLGVVHRIDDLRTGDMFEV